MLALDTTTALLQVITSAAAAVDTHVSAIDHDQATGVFGTYTEFASYTQNQLITTATTTTICASPGGSTIRRNVKFVSVRNSHASTANTVEVKQTNGTTAVSLFKVTLAAGETLIFNDMGTWFVYDSTGSVK